MGQATQENTPSSVQSTHFSLLNFAVVLLSPGDAHRQRGLRAVAARTGRGENTKAIAQSSEEDLTKLCANQINVLLRPFVVLPSLGDAHRQRNRRAATAGNCKAAVQSQPRYWRQVQQPARAEGRALAAVARCRHALLRNDRHAP